MQHTCGDAGPTQSPSIRKTPSVSGMWDLDQYVWARSAYNPSTQRRPCRCRRSRARASNVREPGRIIARERPTATPYSGGRGAGSQRRWLCPHLPGRRLRPSLVIRSGSDLLVQPPIRAPTLDYGVWKPDLGPCTWRLNLVDRATW